MKDRVRFSLTKYGCSAFCAIFFNFNPFSPLSTCQLQKQTKEIIFALLCMSSSQGYNLKYLMFGQFVPNNRTNIRVSNYFLDINLSELKVTSDTQLNFLRNRLLSLSWFSFWNVKVTNLFPLSVVSQGRNLMLLDNLLKPRKNIKWIVKREELTLWGTPDWMIISIGLVVSLWPLRLHFFRSCLFVFANINIENPTDKLLCVKYFFSTIYTILKA